MNEGSQWYSNKELFEMMNSIKIEMLETQAQMRKYNELRRTFNDVMKSQETLTKLVNKTVDKVNDMEAARLSRRETFKDSRDIILTIIAVAGWIMTLVGLFLK